MLGIRLSIYKQKQEVHRSLQVDEWVVVELVVGGTCLLNLTGL